MVDAIMVGGVLSILIEMIEFAAFPALSVAVPVVTWFDPSVVMVTGLVQLLTPDSESVQVKSNVTSVLFQPLVFGAGEVDPVIAGGVLSRFIVTDVVAAFPARSMAVPEIT